MRESEFVEQNREKWSGFESEMSYGFSRPGQLHDVFIQVTDDLSHAQTFYPSRSVRAYLNALTQKVHKHIKQHREARLKALYFFFFEDLPEVIYHARHSFYAAFALFGLAFVIGYVSASYDASFANFILGDSYVEMTEENIKKMDPMAVYKQEKEVDMAFSIILNNIWVSLRCFLMGLFAGIGSVAIMLYNGVMIGAFIQFFARYNLLWEANLTIWMHGVFEVAAIIIGTAAGIRMGISLLFPGTYTRLQAFRVASRQAIKIMVAVIGLLFVAGLIEGFLTRWTSLGSLRLVFIVACLLFLMAYFIFLPYYKYKKGFRSDAGHVYIEPDLNESIEYLEIRDTSRILGDALRFMRLHSAYIGRWALGLSLMHAFLAYFSNIELGNRIRPGIAIVIPYIDHFIWDMDIQDATTSQVLTLLLPIFTGSFVFILYRKMHQEAEGLMLSGWGTAFVAFLSLPLLIFLLSWLDSSLLSLFIFIASFTLFAYWNFFLQRQPHVARAGRGVLNALKHGLTHTILVYLLVSSLYFFISFLMASQLMRSYMRFMDWFILKSDNPADVDYAVLLMLVVYNTFFYYLLGFLTVCLGMIAYNSVEIEEAPGLLKKLENVGQSRQIKGMARE